MQFNNSAQISRTRIALRFVTPQNSTGKPSISLNFYPVHPAYPCKKSPKKQTRMNEMHRIKVKLVGHIVKDTASQKLPVLAQETAD